jgi:hypothetical protein
MVDRQEVRVFNGTWAEDHLHGCTEGALVHVGGRAHVPLCFGYTLYCLTLKGGFTI